MAAKQGLTAQLSQAGEDAKRAVLSRTAPSSWFSNLNTVCTIKSAPPRSPEILQMLATKSGWLWKRNEQHVWQARWCCVVPHTFLYYFDGVGNGGGGGGSCPLPLPTAAQQDEWNKAVSHGLGNRKQHEKRSSLYLFNHNNHHQQPPLPPEELEDASPAAAAVIDEQNRGTAAAAAPLLSAAPAGIIDLECYTHVHPSSEDHHVLELAGDDTVDPDLRAFYFCADNEADCEDWSDALLHNRHAALMDEVDAYKQVCDGFASQLQVLHQELDDKCRLSDEAQEELYQVRSQQEDVRRQVWRLLEDALDVKVDDIDVTKRQRQLRDELERAKSQDLGVSVALRLWNEYTQDVTRRVNAMATEQRATQAQLQESGRSDTTRVRELEQQLQLLQEKYDHDTTQWQQQVDSVKAKFEHSQKELQDVQKDLSSTRMEVTMFQNQQKNKVNELMTHKKILKKEVIDMRAKLDETNAELNLLRHQQDSHKMRAEQEKTKADLLERYVEKIESQVKQQQNMIEIMSVHGSVHGGGGGSIYGGGNNSVVHRNSVVYVHHNNDDVVVDAADDDDEEDVVAERLLPPPRRAASRRHHNHASMDDDNKSHMSELTEDRTQRHFDAMHLQGQYDGPSPRFNRHRASPRIKSGAVVNTTAAAAAAGPPSYIGVSDRSHPLETINSGGASPMIRHRNSEIPLPGRRAGNGDIISASILSDSSSKQLSVAQRARLEADRQSTPVKAKLDEKTKKALEKASSRSSPIMPRGTTSSHASLGSNNSLMKRMENALLGPAPEDLFSSEDSEGDDGDDDNDDEGKGQMSPSSSIPPTPYTDEDDLDDDLRGGDGEVKEEKKTEGVRRTTAAPVHVPKPPKTVLNAVNAPPTTPAGPKFDDDVMAASPGGSTLSLQERSKLQREKQLKFLKEHGLIKNESDVRQSAGGSVDGSVGGGTAAASYPPTSSAASLAGSKAASSGKS